MTAKLSRYVLIAVAGAMAMAGCGLSVSAQQWTFPPAVPSEELPAGSQVLARGPVHEAFATPVTMDPQAPIVVPRPPPQPIQEMPPAERPAGADIVWVPGYWAWDADRGDFIWVSGCWRNPPPQTYWVPGHWLQTSAGWQWIAGFWKPIATQPVQQIEYLPAPPAPVQIEAPRSSPLPDQIWVPGCWYWSGGRYVLRPGYWITPQPGWVWVPSHYVWTPRGYIFSPGHWDYDLDNRGVLFTPAYLPPAVRVQVGFVFSPGICVDLGILRLNLFAYPRYRHYYFGDYYDDAYLRVGIYPWHRCQTIHTWYDPLFVHDRWKVRRTEPNWARRQAQEFEMRRANRDLRPAHTFAEFQSRMDRMPAAKRPERSLVQPVRTFAASPAAPVRFERITPAERQQISARSTEIRDLRSQRTQWEAPSGPPPSSMPAAARQQPATQIQKTREARSTPPPAVRITRPEQVTVPHSPAPSRPSDSRYIERVAPGRPPQEQSRVGAAPNTKPSGKDSRGPSQPRDARGSSRGR